MTIKIIFSRNYSGLHAMENNKTTEHMSVNTERKASGSNWNMYKNLISKPKTEKNSNKGNNNSQTKRHPKSLRMNVTSRHAVSNQYVVILFEIIYIQCTYIFITYLRYICIF